MRAPVSPGDIAASMKTAEAPASVIDAVLAAYSHVMSHLQNGHNGEAATYLTAIPRVIAESHIYGSSKNDALRVQVLYLLGNLHWSGPEAAKHKTVLRTFALERKRR